MIINIKRQQDKKKLEELKYTLILKKSHLGGIGYDWNLKGDEPDESLEDNE